MPLKQEQQLKGKHKRTLSLTTFRVSIAVWVWSSFYDSLCLFCTGHGGTGFHIYLLYVLENWHLVSIRVGAFSVHWFAVFSKISPVSYTVSPGPIITKQNCCVAFEYALLFEILGWMKRRWNTRHVGYYPVSKVPVLKRMPAPLLAMTLFWGLKKTAHRGQEQVAVQNEEAIKRKILQIQGDTELTLDK